jgi:hypothetical protein
MSCTMRPSCHSSFSPLSYPSHHVSKLPCTPLSTPVPFLARSSHGIGHTTHAQTRQNHARHAVSAHGHVLDAPEHARVPSPQSFPPFSSHARAITTTPVPSWTRPLARGSTNAVAMIQALPRPYCKHSIVACTLSSSLSCAFTRVVLALITAT